MFQQNKKEKDNIKCLIFVITFLLMLHRKVINQNHDISCYDQKGYTSFRMFILKKKYFILQMFFNKNKQTTLYLFIDIVNLWHFAAEYICKIHFIPV